MHQDRRTRRLNPKPHLLYRNSNNELKTISRALIVRYVSVVEIDKTVEEYHYTIWFCASHQTNKY